MLSAIRGEFSHYVVRCVAVNCVFFVRHFTVNILGIFSGDSLLIFSVCCLAIRLYCPHCVVGCLVLNYLDFLFGSKCEFTRCSVAATRHV